MSEQKNELRQIITDALVSMVSGVTGLVPPTGPGAIPDFIQAPIDRAVEKVSASLPVGVPDDPLPHWEPCNPGCDPEFNGSRSRYCAELCHNAREALAPAAQTVTAEQVQCSTCNDTALIGDLPIECPDCCRDEAPSLPAATVPAVTPMGGYDFVDASLPAAGSAVDRVVATAPERIYLIIGDDCPRDVDFSELGEVAWCEEEAEQGIEYVRAALSAQQSAPERVSVPVELLEALLAHIEESTCTHDNTHRGGAIWEICDDCGAQWADDRGGKPVFKWPDCVEETRAILASHGRGEA